MAVFYGGKSKHLLLGISFFRILTLTFLFISGVVLIYANYQLFINPSFGFLFVLIIIFGPLFYLLDKLIKNGSIDFKKYFNGFKGEASVWYHLHRLPDTYSVFQGIKISDPVGDIDFVLSGPTGVYTIEVKSYKGKIGFDGEQITRNDKRIKEYILKQAMDEALDLNNLILAATNENVFVTPVLVFSSSKAQVSFGFKKVKNVYVIQKCKLIDLLTTGYQQEVSLKVLTTLKSLVSA